MLPLFATSSPPMVSTGNKQPDLSARLVSEWRFPIQPLETALVIWLYRNDLIVQFLRAGGDNFWCIGANNDGVIVSETAYTHDVYTRLG